MLITSGSKESYNMMMASWGGLGILWYKPICFIFVRPSRYTFQFLEKNDYFSLSFFTNDYRAELDLCGSKSGREINKMKEVNLTPIEETNTFYFKESRMVLICKKLYLHDIKTENFLSAIKEDIYKDNNFHRMYIGEIIKCLVKNDE